jgi:hypothetical protein
MLASRDRLPYWEYAIGAVAIMFVLNIWLHHANKNHQISPNRSTLIGFSVDTLLLMLVSSLAIRASAEIDLTPSNVSS